ncbi:MAG: DNA-binding protein, H-NS family [uncultured Thiotrichaceae bacterium]|uniref:DNA-binding protein, H-NS family n=1 Tax=uncultured Thiotrichaceae bacterium TaxID=298394 RepID=A0A6S6UAQ3_9GAMM|nr:MAG: DNA-binding protein, H-NS family [uncultured Thiotrichaceae bacterium]
MAKVNLDKMSLKELQAIAKDAAKTIEVKKKDGIKALKKKILEEIKDNGLELGDVFTQLKPAPRAAVSPKYANLDNPDQTWTGRGRKPKWVEAHLNNGKTLEDLLIEK